MEIGMMGDEELRERYGWMLDGEFATLLEQRTATYGFTARLYCVEVDQAFLDELCAARWPLSTGNEKIDAGNRLIATYLSGVWENTLTELAVDYVRVFVGHSTDIGTAAFPYESVYTSEKHLLMQEARDEVLAIYRSTGLDKEEDWKEGEDHIALELEFQRIMALRCAEALKAGNLRAALPLLETQGNFF